VFIQLISDIKKYREYIIHNVFVSLKLNVSNTILGYFWWLLDPLLNMMVYSVLVIFIFDRDIENYAVFLFCALLSWKWFNSTVTYSSSCIRSNMGILSQIYMPKFILPLQEVIVNFIKYLFGFAILICMMAVSGIAPSFHFIEIIFVLIVNFLFIFGCSLLIAHYGVYINDLKNFLGHFLRIWWYLSPGIYSLSIVPEQYRWIFWANPNTTLFESYRNVIMYGSSPNYLMLSVWGAVSILLIIIGLRKLYIFDRKYSKII